MTPDTWIKYMAIMLMSLYVYIGISIANTMILG